MKQNEMEERKALYIEEWRRLTEVLKTKDPLSDEYKTLSVRVSNLEQAIANLDRAYFEEVIKLKEFDFKNSKENFEEELAAEKAYNEAEKAKADLLKVEIGSAESLVSNIIKVGGGVFQSYVAGKCMLAVARGLLSDEESGKLVFSKVLGFIQKPSLWSFRI